MAKRTVRKSTKKTAKRSIANRIPEKHHNRVIVYGGLIAIALMILISSTL